MRIGMALACWVVGAGCGGVMDEAGGAGQGGAGRGAAGRGGAGGAGAGGLGGTGGAGAGGAGGTGGATSGAVTGKSERTGSTEDGVLRSAVDLSGKVVEAYVPEGGGFRKLPGTGHADGTFEIPGVPDGPYWLRVDDSFRWTTERNPAVPDGGEGRPDTARATAGTRLLLHVDGARPWKADDLPFYSRGAGAIYPELEMVAAARPAEDATSFDLDVELFEGDPLIDGGRGDRAVLGRTEVCVEKPEHCKRLTQAAWLPPFSMTPGATTEARATLSDLALDRSTTIDWKHSAFAALIEAANPGAIRGNASLDVFAVPSDLDGWGYGRTLLELWAPEDSTSDVSPGALPYGNPYGAGARDEVLSAFYMPTVRVKLAGTQAGAAVRTMVGYSRPMDGTAPIEPVISAPLGFEVAGMPAGPGAEVAGVGTTPRLRWQAPRTGLATGYSLAFYELAAQGTATSSRAVGRYFSTAEPEAHLPPGILEAGKAYVARVSAYGERDRASGSASLVTGVFRP